MAENKKTNTNALDVGAMYQIGAAGAGAAKAGNEGLRMLQRIGEFAIGFKLKSIENFKKAQNETNRAFATLEDAVIQHDLDLSESTLTEVSKIKDQVTSANKIMTSMKYNLRPGSDEYKAANKTKTNALLNLKKLEKANSKLSETFASTLKISNGEEFVEGPNGSRYQVELGGTSKELYHSSLIVSGEFLNATEWDSKKGEYVVNMKNIDPLEDDPDTEVDESTLKKVPLSSFSFAKPSTYQEDPGEKYISSMISFGQKGENSLSEGGRKRILSGLEDDLIATNPRDFAQLLFKGTISVNGESISYIDAIVEDELGTALGAIEGGVTEGDDMIDNPSYVEGGDAPEKILESELYALSIIGAKETIKDAIINGDETIITKYKKVVENLVVKNADKAFEEEAELYEKNKNKNKVLTQREIAASEKRGVSRKIDNHKDLTMQPGVSGPSKGLKRRLKWFDTHKVSFINNPDPYQVKTGATVEAGWHVVFQQQGTDKWIFEGATNLDVIAPTYATDEAAKDYYQIEY